jgi:hypothetical protein
MHTLVSIQMAVWWCFHATKLTTLTAREYDVYHHNCATAHKTAMRGELMKPVGLLMVTLLKASLTYQRHNRLV